MLLLVYQLNGYFTSEIKHDNHIHEKKSEVNQHNHDTKVGTTHTHNHDNKDHSHDNEDHNHDHD